MPPHDRETPLDSPTPIAEDVFIVDSVMQRPFGLILPVRMTILRLSRGDLLLHSPTRLTPTLCNALERLGRVRYLVAPNSVHWMFLRQWQRAYPEAETWAAPGLRERRRVRRSGVRLDYDLSETTPAGWQGVQLVVVPGAMGFREVALFHTASRTMVLTDLVLDLPMGQAPPLLRPVTRMLGIVGSDGKPPVYLRWIIRWRGEEAVQAAQRLLAMAPERVVFAHGHWFRRDASSALRHALRWLLR
jgi:hypothetical protein